MTRVMAQVLAAVPVAGLDAVPVAVELVIESGALSAEHVLNVLARLNASPPLPCVETSLQLREAPLADTSRYDSLRGAPLLIHSRCFKTRQPDLGQYSISANRYVLKVPSWRLVVSIKNSVLLIEVIEIDHRSKIYRWRPHGMPASIHANRSQRIYRGLTTVVPKEESARSIVIKR